jgi:hypothetical protein
MYKMFHGTVPSARGETEQGRGSRSSTGSLVRTSGLLGGGRGKVEDVGDGIDFAGGPDWVIWLVVKRRSSDLLSQITAHHFHPCQTLSSPELGKTVQCIEGMNF